ncbi:CBS domain-containing protein [Candidatus Woesearchaeota archaeon]|nr:CBS domain-containing protein [Candidatus Woesearchaeota archaeon]
MHPDLSDIKRLRKRHSLTQFELARKAQVSQSLIAKIESGRIDPAYTGVTRIFNVLNSISEEEEHKAEELMVRKIISCSSNDTVSIAIKGMKAHNISQLPVIDNNVAVGLVTESNLIENLAEKRDISHIMVSDVMQESPPVVSRKTPLRIILDLLRYSPLILISDNGRLEGVITKSDVLRMKN